MTFSFPDDTEWLRTLIGHLEPQEAAGLCPVLDSAPDGPTQPERGTGPKTEPATETAGLLAFYIRRAQAALAAGDRAAQAQLDLLHAGITASASRPVKATPTPPPAVLTQAPAVATPPAPANPANLTRAVQIVYRRVMQREAAEKEIGIWLRNFANGLAFHDFLLLMEDSPEARAVRERDVLAAGMTDADFIQAVYCHLEDRGAVPAEIDLFRAKFDKGELSRATLLQNFFAAAIAREARGPEPLHDGLSCAVMGTPHVLTLAEWEQKAADTEARDRARAALRPAMPFAFRAEPGVEITAIASLFRGGDFIEQFMDNITSQSCFDRHCELIIIDADSPENESETISRYLGRHPGVRYQRMNSCVGIYEAWNIGVRMARGRYLTNTNLDDLRRRDSLEIQAGALQALPFVDVVYQDFYYSFDPTLGWEDVAAFGYKSDVPVITPYNLMRFNAPHNAPMWRRSLHDDVGLFDASFRSAGDYEFWMRCLAAGKTFYKINEPHVVYYQNPKGLSTRSDTRGLVEARAILRTYAPRLIAQAFTAPLPAFAQDMLGLPATLVDTEKDRGMLAQRALRDLARRSKAAMGASATSQEGG